MVWLLTAADPAGPGPFYFTAPCIYSVGRKDCAITIQTDKSISRLHAEISVETAPLLLPAEKRGDDKLPKCKVLLKDLSKFGTFVNKETDSKPLNSSPDSVTALKEGDIITFGIKAVFRLQDVPIVLCMSPSTFPSTIEVRSKAEAAGAYVFEQWNCQCTHLLVEETSPVTDLVIAAVLSKKPVVLLEWLQDLMSKSSPRDQLPNLSRYIPTLRMDSKGLDFGTPVAEPLAREEVLAGFTVFLQKGGLYHNHDLPNLVAAAGGVLNFFTHDNLKDIAGLVRQNGLLVFPVDQTSRKDCFARKVLPSVPHMRVINEEYLLRSILSAKLDLSSNNVSPAASVDTDETVNEEDLEIETDVASFVPQEIIQVTETLQLSGHIRMDEMKDSGVRRQPNPIVRPSSFLQAPLTESSKFSEKISLPTLIRLDSVKEIGKAPSIIETSIKKPALLAGAELPLKAIIKSEDSLAPSGEVTAEVIFSSGLMVQKDSSGSAEDVWNGAVPNFKCFKKGVAAYGNSFSSLVPFAKEPYRESDYRQEMGEYIKQEKKRKEAELLADDLFNSEQLKRRKVMAAKGARASTSRAGQVV